VLAIPAISGAKRQSD